MIDEIEKAFKRWYGVDSISKKSLGSDGMQAWFGFKAGWEAKAKSEVGMFMTVDEMCENGFYERPKERES